MTYPDSVQFLYALGNEMKTAKLGLERIEAILAALRHPERDYRVVHVAGTNGKGSVCAMIDAGLRASVPNKAGIRTGLFTSPHLIEPTERIQVDGMPVSKAQFSRAFDVIHQTAESLDLDAHPSYFETVAAMAFWIFREQGVETAVIEVGLGGRLDATNVVQPALTVITPVDMDHQAWLGDTIEAIAFEKAGILKRGVPAVLAKQRPDAAKVIDARAAELAIPVHRTSDYEIRELENDARGGRFTHNGQRIEVPLPGDHQIENAMTAALALEELGVSAQAIAEGIKDTRWPGRLEFISPNPDVLLDGAHNPAGAQALAAYLQKHYPHRKRWMIFGAMGDKAVEEVARILFPLADELILTVPASPRSMPVEDLVKIAQRVSGLLPETAPDILAAFQWVAARASADDLIIVTGSLYLVGEARAASYNKNSWPFSGAWSS